MKRTLSTWTGAGLVLVGAYVLMPHLKPLLSGFGAAQLASVAALSETDKKISILSESAHPDDSDDVRFWLNSGAQLYLMENYGYTIQGELPTYSRWRLRYRVTTPTDTDDGYHPQNIFRLITRKAGSDVLQSSYFLVTRDNLSRSPNRNASNGIFLINRFVDSNNLYYAGIRVDGSAVIKKKRNGVYHTLAQIRVFEGDAYDKYVNPSLLPKNRWIGLRSSVATDDDGSVKLELFLDRDGSGDWQKTLSVSDPPSDSPVLDAGYGGIRSDFMDIEFRHYSFETIR